MHFFTFCNVLQTCFADNFVMHFWKIFSHQIRKKKFLVILALLETLKLIAQKRLQKSKNVDSKCVLDFNFAPIKGYVFLIFFKKITSVVPLCKPRKIYSWVQAYNKTVNFLIFFKGQFHEIFCFRFFSCVIFPQAPENNTGIISKF